MSVYTRREAADRIEADLARYLADPMPPDLKAAVADLIEPHTQNMEIRHRDVMECIHVAWPMIRDWVEGHR